MGIVNGSIFGLGGSPNSPLCDLFRDELVKAWLFVLDCWGRNVSTQCLPAWPDRCFLNPDRKLS